MPNRVYILVSPIEAGSNKLHGVSQRERRTRDMQTESTSLETETAQNITQVRLRSIQQQYMSIVGSRISKIKWKIDYSATFKGDK